MSIDWEKMSMLNLEGKRQLEAEVGRLTSLLRERDAKAWGPEHELVINAAIEQVGLWQEIEKSGLPPHTDFWLQSIHERRKALIDAVTRLRASANGNEVKK